MINWAAYMIFNTGWCESLHPRSFADDPTRMFRAVRYEKRYDFNIAQETSALIPEARQLIEKLTAQRIRHELDLILDETNAASMLARLDKLGLLKPIHPSLRCDKALQTRVEFAKFFRSDFRVLDYRISAICVGFCG